MSNKTGIPSPNGNNGNGGADDGTLIDITPLARNHGFHCPLFVTRAVHERFVLPPDGPFHTEDVGSVWTILHWLLVDLPQRPRASTSQIFRVQHAASSPTFTRLNAIATREAHGRPTVTVKLADES